MAKATDTTATDTETAEIEGVRVEQVDPATLLVDVNVRTETVADKDFVASVQDLGVLQPIRAVRTTDGSLRVETGHRRTLAALEAGLATVPVLVIADDRTDDAGTVERIVRQYAENEHRTGLTTVDRLGVVEQLSLLNVSAAQIAKRTRMKRPEVDQALAVTGSDLAKAASVRYDLTLDQAAAVAEFEDDTETVKALVAAAKSGQFDHVLERARQDRDDTRERAQAATGVRMIKGPGVGATRPSRWAGTSATPTTTSSRSTSTPPARPCRLGRAGLGQHHHRRPGLHRRRPRRPARRAGRGPADPRGTALGAGLRLRARRAAPLAPRHDEHRRRRRQGCCGRQ
jgi:ParB/RepB/Spo0J family partition protein